MRSLLVALAAIHLGSAPAAPSQPPPAAYRWPLDGHPAVVRAFEPPPQPWLAGHRGVDLGAAPGAQVRAAGAGTVHFAGRAVARGSPIGSLRAGHAACPVVACLHWGLRRGEAYLDPLSLLEVPRIRLLPL